jgi:hypothetical protein
METNKFQTVKQLQALLTSKQFVLTGSTVFEAYGLIPKGSSKDIDIVLYEPSEEALKIAQNLQENFPCKKKPFEGSKVKFIFSYNGFKVDIFITSKKRETLITLEGIELSKIQDIIEAKKSSARFKDFIQLRTIARSIFKEEDLQIFLDKNPNCFEKIDY